MLKFDHELVLLAFVVVTGLAVSLQAIILFLIFLALRKAANGIREEVENLRASIMPVLFDTRDLLANTQGALANTQALVANAQGFMTRVGPKIEAATADVVDITHRLREQVAELQSSTGEILNRVRRQSNRVDDMLSGFLNRVDYAGSIVIDAVNKPVRQVSGILRSAKAIVESLRTPVARR